MDLAAVREEIERLRAAIARHDDLYYNRATSEITDQDYDALVRRLVELEAAHPELTEGDSPLDGVGRDRDLRFPSAPHSHPMISLQNSYELADVSAFVRRVSDELPERRLRFTVEPKIDGVALAVRYRDGRLESALTRGDGRHGDVITANVLTFRDVPGTLPDGWRDALPGVHEAFEVRGEAYLALSRFRGLNREREAEGEEPLANPRNATAGTLKTLDPAVVEARGLSAFFYQVLPLDDASLELDSHEREVGALTALGLPVNPFLRVADDAREIEACLAELEGLRPELDYQIDGAVLKVDDLRVYARLGSTARAPRWGLAFKYAAETAETRLSGVTLQVGRTGVITPVAELEPVVLAGTTVARATLHNWDEIGRKDIRVGDVVRVAKGGDVIPKVLGVVTERRTGGETVIAEPERCPVCESEVRREEGQVAVRCANRLCPAQAAGRLRHFVGREAADVEGLGERGIEQLLEEGLAVDPADLFRLDPAVVAGLPGWGEVSAASLTESLERARGRPWANKIFSLGIPGVGITTAGLLAGAYAGIDALAAADHDGLVALYGVGSDMADDILAFLGSEEGREFVDDLKNVGYLLVVEEQPEQEESFGDSWFADRRVVLTGSFERWSRSDAKRMIEARGGKVVGSVSGKTDAVICGAKPGSKLEKARDLGVRVLHEDDLVGLLGGGTVDDDA